MCECRAGSGGKSSWAGIRKTDNPNGTKEVLLIASCGGHWVQINRLLSAFEGHDLHFCSTEKDYAGLVPNGKFSYVPDASRSSGAFQLLWQSLNVLKVLLVVRPDVVVTTGAAPGFFAVFFGKKLGAKTVWVDSIANVDEVSMSGRKAAKYADLYITQWEHLAAKDGPVYYGSVV